MNVASKIYWVIVKLFAKKTYLPFYFVICLVLIYVIYQGLYGYRGVISANNINKEIKAKQKELLQLQDKKAELTNKIELLRDPSPNSDYLDQLARSYFAVGSKEERMVIIND